MPLGRRIVVGCCTLALLGAATAQAQGVAWELIGIVRHPNGSPLEGATVAIPGTSMRTNAQGMFRISTTRRDTLTLAVRRIGYLAVSTLLTDKELTGDTLVIVLEPTTQQLDEVQIKARDLRSAMGLGSFEERRATGQGVYITREEIVRRNSTKLTDVLRNKRGINIVRVSQFMNGVRFSTYSGSSALRRCAPEIWIDGQRARGMELDEIPANTVEGIELYHSLATTPVQFSTGSTNTPPCGTIVVWTREPGSP